MLPKIRALRRLCDERGLDPIIEVDGGISGANAWQVIEAGANGDRRRLGGVRRAPITPRRSPRSATPRRPRG